MEQIKNNNGGTRPGAGRPLGVAGLKRRAAKHADDALAALVSVTTDSSAPPACRVQAATAILEYGLGKQPAGKAAAPLSEGKP